MSRPGSGQDAGHQILCWESGSIVLQKRDRWQPKRFVKKSCMLSTKLQRNAYRKSGTPFPKISTWVLWLNWPLPLESGGKTPQNCIFSSCEFTVAYTKKYKATLLESQCRPFQICQHDLCELRLPKTWGWSQPPQKCIFRFAGKRSVYRISEQLQWNNIIGSQGHPSKHDSRTK